jgi:micrococcal nuclease
MKAGLARRFVVFAATVVVAASGFAIASSASAGRNCTPGYRPCIPNRRSDVDCFGGGGNGPRYTRPGVVYRVTGSDRYRLDADNDGRGCE